MIPPACAHDRREYSRVTNLKTHKTILKIGNQISYHRCDHDLFYETDAGQDPNLLLLVSFVFELKNVLDVGS